MNILLESLQNHGYILESFEEGLVNIAKKGKKELLFVGTYSPLVPYNIGLILSNKSFVKAILTDGHISVPEGKTFSPDSVQDAMVYVQMLGFPVVLKQENSQKNIHSIYPIINLAYFRTSFASLAKSAESIIVEKYCSGIIHHVYYDCDGYINILEVKEGISYIAMSELQKKNSRQHDVDMTDYYEKKMRTIAKKVLGVFPPMKYICFSIVNSSEVLEVYHSADRHMKFLAHKGKATRSILEYMATLCEKS